MKARTILPAILVLGSVTAASGQDGPPSFFLTSENPGQGANLGGLEGADAYCTSLAETAGLTGQTWRAYLSTSEVDARDRIGAGPWYNVAGVLIATDVDTLHGDDSGINKDTALNERGEVVNGRGDEPNRHDILTGSDLDGQLVGEACADWTSDGEGSAMVGHHEREGGGGVAPI